MKTKMLVMYLHERPTRGLVGMLTKKSGEPSRPMRGEKIGVGVALVVGDNHYVTNYSMVNPVGFDRFDKHIAVNYTLGKIMSGDAKPSLCFPTERDTKRGAYIRKQIAQFEEQAAKVFKDKTPL